MPKVSAPKPPKKAKRLPCFGSLQNQSTGEYRYDRVTRMDKKFVLPDCLFKFELRGDLEDYIYAIKNVKNNEYLHNHMQTMAKKEAGKATHWQFTDAGNGTFYIQNRENNEYLTSRAGHLASGANVPGAEQVYIVGDHCG